MCTVNLRLLLLQVLADFGLNIVDGVAMYRLRVNRVSELKNWKKSII